MLIAGTTLGFAKENVKTEKSIGTESAKIEIETNNIAQVESVETVKGLCYTTIVTKNERPYTSYNMLGQATQMVEVTYTFTTYWYGCNK